MRFTKMHGLGNDYIFLNCLEGAPDDLPELSRRLSRRPASPDPAEVVAGNRECFSLYRSV